MPSIFVVSSKEEIDTKTVTNELLEKILSKDNMNTAFKRVKSTTHLYPLFIISLAFKTASCALLFGLNPYHKIKEISRKSNGKHYKIYRNEIKAKGEQKQKQGRKTMDLIFSNKTFLYLHIPMLLNSLYLISSNYHILSNITRFIETKLRLKVNKNKSKVERPWRIKYLGFSFYQDIPMLLNSLYLISSNYHILS